MTTVLTYMTRALELAELGRYTVSPNPMVGCVLVKDNEIIGTGYHQKAGEHHAEILALQQAGERAMGATAYVTLEPCCHHGRTPPCTLALITAGIKKVVVACQDPNPLIAGKGIAQLHDAGIEVEVGLGHDEATKLNKTFFHYIKTKRPYVIAKWAMSLDGKTVTAPTDSKQISNIETQQDAHELRQQVDAILIGAQTARMDNPQLTARLNLQENAKQPLRIILSHDANLPPDLIVFNQKSSAKTLLAVCVPKLENESFWYSQGIDILYCLSNETGDLDLHNLLQQLGQREITSVLVEGGEMVRRQFFTENLVNQVHVYIAPNIIDGFTKKQILQNVETTTYGTDFKISAEFSTNSHVRN